MSGEDKTLTCVQCGKEFLFSTGEQSFYTEKGFASPPKRCKACRKIRRQKKQDEPTGYGLYRSPAFEGSAPEHQKIRNRQRRGGGREGHGHRRHADYRSPAFVGPDKRKFDQEYRSPGFSERDQLNPEDEYRSPGFSEYSSIKPDEEYRAPGYRELREQWHDEKPMFSIICSACGQEAMVPFLPEEKENPMCQECHRLHQRLVAEDAAAQETEIAADRDDTPAEKVEPSDEEPADQENSTAE